MGGVHFEHVVDVPVRPAERARLEAAKLFRTSDVMFMRAVTVGRGRQSPVVWDVVLHGRLLRAGGAVSRVLAIGALFRRS